MYKLSFSISGKVTESTGKTALEALRNLPRPDKIFNKATLTLEHDGVKRTMLMMPAMFKRLWYKAAQPLMAKNIEKGVVGVKA